MFERPVQVDIARQRENPRSVRSALPIPVIIRTHQKTFVKLFLVADSIIPCEYQSMLYALRLLAIRDLPRSIGM
jgi:hypothetical protein